MPVLQTKNIMTTGTSRLGETAEDTDHVSGLNFCNCNLITWTSLKIQGGCHKYWGSPNEKIKANTETAQGSPYCDVTLDGNFSRTFTAETVFFSNMTSYGNLCITSILTLC